jgi:hypothetical protein
VAKVFMVPPKLSLNNQTVRGSRLAWSRLVDLGSIDSGSNPGSPTISIIESPSIILCKLYEDLLIIFIFFGGLIKMGL